MWLLRNTAHSSIIAAIARLARRLIRLGTCRCRLLRLSQRAVTLAVGGGDVAEETFTAATAAAAGGGRAVLSVVDVLYMRVCTATSDILRPRLFAILQLSLGVK